MNQRLHFQDKELSLKKIRVFFWWSGVSCLFALKIMKSHMEDGISQLRLNCVRQLSLL